MIRVSRAGSAGVIIATALAIRTAATASRWSASQADASGGTATIEWAGTPAHGLSLWHGRSLWL